MISYCIPVCNESKELSKLLLQITEQIHSDDEIIILGDQGNVTEQVTSVISHYITRPDVTYIEYPLNKDFSRFKNTFLKYATKKWIFQIDADELVSTFLLKYLHFIVSENEEVEAFALPRLNIVKGLTQEWSSKWMWNVRKKRLRKDDVNLPLLKLCGINSTNIETINFPDYQVRLFKNTGEVFWKNKVHEVLTKGGTPVAIEALPITDEYGISFSYCLFHIKDIDRQIKQNEFYSQI